MSVQMVVCTPLAFYTNDLRAEKPTRAVRVWYQQIEQDLGITIPFEPTTIEFLRFDLRSRIQERIYRVIRERERKLLESYDADMFLPMPLAGKLPVRIPNFSGGGTYQVLSTQAVRAAIPSIRVLIASALDGLDKENAFEEIDFQLRAIDESERTGQPVFFSL